MPQSGDEGIYAAEKLIKELAGSSLPPSFAKLYSQHTRLRTGQPGLTGWREDEASSRLSDATRLLGAAISARKAGDKNWTDGMRRAGELLEWLSHPQLNPDGLPIRLLAAAAYQLAGYPARSTGLLNEDSTELPESKILASLLKADFPNLFKVLTEYWATTVSSIRQEEVDLPWPDVEALSDRLHEWIVNETASSIGVLSATMRWGNESRLERSTDKLAAISKVLLNGTDPYSWLLAKLCSEVASVYAKSSMREHLKGLENGIMLNGKVAFESYLRQNYQNCKVLTWPSQVRGIERLMDKESFALCTPTGSGKTTIAELAILQSMFLQSSRTEEKQVMGRTLMPLALYLTPSRALASEVEAKLSHVLRGLSEEPIIVTGLYGGTDWGPTDAWLTSEDRAVLICTYEKAEALMRFLGPLFLHRISLIVIDEAHSVQFDENKDSLRTTESRSLRLESLGTRLLTHLDQNRSRIIALSAAASGADNALAGWVTGQSSAIAVNLQYRSTRQLIGRLECLPNRGFQIYYDLLDGASLQFEEGGQADKPYVLKPFPQYPSAVAWEVEGPEKRLRPYLFWAAMHLAAPDDKEQQRAVLISIAQGIDGYAKDFLQLLDSTWANAEKPVFFRQPTDPRKLEAWEQCLGSCEDYFGTESREYQLLRRGVAVHHGKMPGLMARLLVEAIQERIVHLVLATSTLSEGVNLPFETVLIPSLRRGTGRISAREFHNLVGRAGRPGFGTEGQSLVLLEPRSSAPGRDAWSIRESRKRYFTLVEDLERKKGLSCGVESAKSPLAELLNYLREQWHCLHGSGTQEDFLNWLEQTAPQKIGDLTRRADGRAIEALDSLDSVLLPAIVEVEQIANTELDVDELELQLKRIWQRSYACYASQQEEGLENLFIRRGHALKERVYPDSSQRRRLYRTSLPPRSGNELIKHYPVIRQHLETGRQYAIWNPDQRFEYIRNVVEQLSAVPKFNLPATVGRSTVVWHEVLRWWLDPFHATKIPPTTQISAWHSFTSQNFGYRFNWGLGGIMALAIDDAYGGELRPPTLEDWPQMGLPWIVLWLKELIVWGTLEPVAAYLLAKGMKVTRIDAEKAAEQYYSKQSRNQNTDEILNAVTIRDWAKTRASRGNTSPAFGPPREIKVNLLRDFKNATKQQWRVVPIEVNSKIYWFDPAGYPLASCKQPKGWQPDYLDSYDFVLDSSKQTVLSSVYI